MSRKVDILINGQNYQVDVLSLSQKQIRFKISEREYLVEFTESIPQGEADKSKQGKQNIPKTRKAISTDGTIEIISPIPGLVSRINLKLGQEIKIGDLLLQIEAMKMQNSIFSEVDGIVSQINIEKGDEVSIGQILLGIKQK